MKKSISLLLVVLGVFVTFAQEKMTFTPYGMAQYRLRYDLTRKDSTFQTVSKENSNILKDTNVILTSGNYSNRIAYKLGLKVNVNPQVLFQFEIGNDWVSTEEVSGLNYNYLNRRKTSKNYDLFPWFSLAYVQWDPGYMHILAGIIPVKGSALLDLYAASIYYNRKYTNAANTPFSVITNGSIQALKLGAPILKGDFKLGVDITATVLEQRTVVSVKNFEYNNDAVTFLLDIPMSFKGLTLTPQFLINVNRNFKDTTYRTESALVIMDKTSNNEIGGGIDLGYKFSDLVSVRCGFGIMGLSNDNITVNKDSIYQRLGMNFTSGATAKLGPGKLDLDFNFSTDKDLEDSNSLIKYPFIDLKYGLALNKNFSIIPRLRFFITLNHDESSLLIGRPELIVSGSF